MHNEHMYFTWHQISKSLWKVRSTDFLSNLNAIAIYIILIIFKIIYFLLFTYI